MSFGTWIRGKLLEAGREGVTVADLHKARREAQQELREEGGPFYRNGTYNSFARYFSWFKQLEFVEEVPDGIEPSATKRTVSHEPATSLQSPRHYYRISNKGQRAAEEEWQDPILTYLGIRPYDRYKPYRKYKPTGRPRGRPPKISWEAP